MDSTLLVQAGLTALSGAASIFVAKIRHSISKREKERAQEEERRKQAEQRREEEADALREGMQAMLRDRILELYSHCKKQGFVNTYEARNMDHMYDAYHRLGGNGMITSVHEQFIKLPIDPEGNV